MAGSTALPETAALPWKNRRRAAPYLEGIGERRLALSAPGRLPTGTAPGGNIAAV